MRYACNDQIKKMSTRFDGHVVVPHRAREEAVQPGACARKLMLLYPFQQSLRGVVEC